jgi:hypothetical protein
MDKDVLNSEAQKLMASYKDSILKNSETDRKKALKKWQKKNPNLNINNSAYSL